MKNKLRFLAVYAVLAFVAITPINDLLAQDAPPPPDSQVQDDTGDDQDVSFQTFYDQLGDQGTWIQTDDYGYVFQPNVNDPDWAPYTDGHWVYTDDGWTWVSDESWGWATYHYGRWANIDDVGWVWVPGYRWAPAWVSWRYGGGYAGWAPLPPETFVGAEYGVEDRGPDVDIGFHFGSDVDVSFNIGPGCYNFVRIGDMGERNYRGHYLERDRNYTVINQTTNITNINIDRNSVDRGDRHFRGVNVGGPRFADVNSHARNHVQEVQLTEARGVRRGGRDALNGNSLAVYAPRVNPTTLQSARPNQVSQRLSNPQLNRGDTITKPLDVTSRVKAQPATPEAIQAAQAARLHAPEKAKIATEQTRIQTPLSKPLTALQPVRESHRPTNAPAPGSGNTITRDNALFHQRQNGEPVANSPATGEPVNRSLTTRPNELAPATPHQTEIPQRPAAAAQNLSSPVVTPKRSDPANSPYTGEPASQAAQAPRWKRDQQGEFSARPQQAQEGVPASRPQHEQPSTPFHPQQEQQAERSFHPQQQTSAPSFHPQQEQQAERSFHPQQQTSAPSFHPQQEQQAEHSFRPQQQQSVEHSFRPQQEHHDAPPQQPHGQPAPAPGNSHPSATPNGGGGNKSPGNPNEKNQQGH